MTDHTFAWTPTPEQIAAAKVTRLMLRHQITDYHALIERATREPAWYWQAVIDDLEIVFSPAFRTVVDLEDGVEWPRWFDQGGINIAKHCVTRWAKNRPSATAISAEDEDGSVERCTYAELDAAVDGIAGLLIERGVRQGDRVALLVPLGRYGAAAMYAVMKLGAIAVPMFTGFSAAAIAERMRACGAAMIIAVESSSRRGKRIDLAVVARDALVQASGRAMLTLERGESAWRALVARGKNQRHMTAPTTAEAPAMINYTSGTTGSPKGAVHVHGGLLVKVASEAAYLTDLGSSDVALWITDMGWLMGPWLLIGAHAAGAAVATFEGAIDYPDPARLWRVCEEQSVSMLGVSPTLTRTLARSVKDAPRQHDLSALRILASTGEPWDRTSYLWLLEAVGQGRCPIVNISGGTEVGACFVGQPPVVPAKACSVGLPVPGMAIDVVDDQGRPIRGKIGELVCRQAWPAQTRGLWGDPERYIATYWSRFAGMWVHGDWTSIDADGYWFIHGRSDDTLNIAGKRIGPAEIEEAILLLPEIAECAAVGMPDELKGTAVWCFCVLAREYDPDQNELERAAREAVSFNIGHAFANVRILVCRSLPKTRSGKIVRRAIRARALGLDAGDVSSLESPDAIASIDDALRLRAGSTTDGSDA